MKSNKERILELFKKNHILTAVDLMENLPEMNKSTVYRNIKKLLKSGEIKEIATKEETASYELVDNKHHHHVVCKICGIVKSYKPPYTFELQVKALEQVLSRTKKFEIDEHNLDFYGVCEKCRR